MSGKEIIIPRKETIQLSSQEQAILDEIRNREAWQKNVVPFMIAATKHYVAWTAGLVVSCACFFGLQKGEWLWWLCFAFGILVSSFQTWNDQEKIIKELLRRMTERDAAFCSELSALHGEVKASQEVLEKEREEWRQGAPNLMLSIDAFAMEPWNIPPGSTRFQLPVTVKNKGGDGTAYNWRLKVTLLDKQLDAIQLKSQRPIKNTIEYKNLDEVLQSPIGRNQERTGALYFLVPNITRETFLAALPVEGGIRATLSVQDQRDVEYSVDQDMFEFWLQSNPGFRGPLPDIGKEAG